MVRVIQLLGKAIRAGSNLVNLLDYFIRLSGENFRLLLIEVREGHFLTALVDRDHRVHHRIHSRESQFFELTNVIFENSYLDERLFLFPDLVLFYVETHAHFFIAVVLLYDQVFVTQFAFYESYLLEADQILFDFMCHLLLSRAAGDHLIQEISDLNQLLLLISKLFPVVVTAHGSDDENVLEFGILFKNFIQMRGIHAVDRRLRVMDHSVVVLILNLH